MWTVINFQDMTDFIPPDDEENGTDSSGGIQANASLSDPNSTWDFHLDDPNQQIVLRNTMPVIVFDENAKGLGNVPTIPAMNFALNSTLYIPVSTLNNWTAGGTLASLWNYTGSYPVITFANNALGSATQEQTTLPEYVQPGVSYMLSFYFTGSGTISNIQLTLQIQFIDASGNPLGSATNGAWIPTLTEQHVNIVATAPANTAFAQITFGVQTTVANNNSGTLNFGDIQFEPMWFATKGVSYPTPNCNESQVNSVLMPDGTSSRACRRFAGYIENHINSYVGKQRHYEVKCASSSKLLETIGLVSASYTATQDTAILSNVLSNLPVNTSPIGQLSTGQQNYYAPTSTLINGVIIDSISWNNATLRQILNDLTSQSGSLYFVDAYYYLWYVPPSFAGTTISLSDTPDNITTFPYANFSIEYDFTNPVNTALVVGSKQKAAVFTQTFSGNGSTTVFNLTYPPENVHGMSISGVTVRTGVSGIDDSKFGTSGSGKTYQALINKQAQTLKFATAPASGTNNVSISYTYEDQVISQVIAADAVAKQGTQFWGLVNDSAITSTVAAKNRGLAELASYAYDRTILNFDLLGIYMPPGSLTLFTNQSEGLTGAPFVIQTVQSDLQGGGIDNWQYTAGVYNPTIIDHLRNATKAIQKSPTTANVVVIASIDVALFDSLHINDSVSATTSNYASVVGVDNPIVYYRLGESAGTTAYDISGNGHNGTIAGGVTLSQTGALVGDTNKAMFFDGSTGWISGTASIASGSGTWSIEAWVKRSGAPSVLSIIASFGTWGTANETAFLAIDTSGFAQIGTFSGNHSSSVSVVDGNWHYLLGIYDGTNMKLYVDGNTTPAVSVAQTMALTGTGVAVASAPSSIHDPLAGTVDEVAFYNFQLSTTRMSAHYNAGI